jgi:hypothetical protein
MACYQPGSNRSHHNTLNSQTKLQLPSSKPLRLHWRKRATPLARTHGLLTCLNQSSATPKTSQSEDQLPRTVALSNTILLHRRLDIILREMESNLCFGCAKSITAINETRISAAPLPDIPFETNFYETARDHSPYHFVVEL